MPRIESMQAIQYKENTDQFNKDMLRSNHLSPYKQKKQ